MGTSRCVVSDVGAMQPQDPDSSSVLLLPQELSHHCKGEREKGDTVCVRARVCMWTLAGAVYVVCSVCERAHVSVCARLAVCVHISALVSARV